MSSFKSAGSLFSQLFAKPSATLSICIFAAGATLTGHASAASFKCTSHASASEKIVCSDPQLSKLDDRLVVAYQRAKNASPDTKSIEAARTEQWLWRQRNCTDKACVLNWYERRIAELDADYQQTQPTQRAALEASLIDRNVEPSASAAIRQLKLSSKMAATPMTTRTSR